MASIELELVHGNFGFESKDENGNIVKMDSSPEFGGENYGTRPMLMLLHALAACSSIDAINILRKQKQTIEHYKVFVKGERGAEGDVSLWKTIDVAFQLQGEINKDKADKAFKLSIEKYCSVATTLIKAGATINYTVELI